MEDNIIEDFYGIGYVKCTNKSVAHWSNKFVKKRIRLINGNNEILAEVNDRFIGKLCDNIIIEKYPTNITKKIRKRNNIILKISNKFDITEKSISILLDKYNQIFENVKFI